MKFIIPAILGMTILFVSCKKKDSYGYTCTCKEKVSGAIDTTFTLRVGTSGEADYLCNNVADTSNKYGKNVECTLK
ncbi:MAG: hypothetical protein H6551_08170 [Chitinophagales bacterium]|nr:hypothetical protein [Chitinophagaceae bacterium]MCB9065098.1 hypothetical protein [Chitinophagales bacterium]